MSKIQYDALIVGSGAAGAFAAKELTSQGLSVLMLEAGPAVGPKDFVSQKQKPKHAINLTERALATLKGQPIQSRALFFSKQLAHFFVNDLKNPYTTPKGEPFLWVRGRQEGGRTHSFGRVLIRWTDDDFKIATRAGRGKDWPFSYDEIEPFYQEVEKSLGLSGNKDNVGTMPDSHYARPATLTKAEMVFKTKVETKDASQNVIAWPLVPPTKDRMLAPMREAKASGLLTLIHDAVVRRVLTDDADQASGVEYIDRLSKTAHIVEAKNVVLCASPVETIRLLLNSASSRHPNGLANSSDAVGRYFMDQIPCLAAGVFPECRGQEVNTSAPKDDFYGPSGGVFIPRAERDISDRSEFAVQTSFGRAPVNSPDADARFSLFAFAQMLPYADNRITLNPRRKDAWGIPVPHIRCVMHDTEKALINDVQAEVLDMYEDAGAVFEFIGTPLGLREMGRGGFPDADPISRFLFRTMFTKSMCMGSAIHEAGGAIMGDDPKDSVLNTWGQTWDIPNLYITDASAFPGSGVSGTTLTVMAQTLRACRHLAQRYKGDRV